MEIPFELARKLHFYTQERAWPWRQQPKTPNSLVLTCFRRNAMTAIVIDDLSEVGLLDQKSMAQIKGGRMKLPLNDNLLKRNWLTSPDGDPVDVYVDGLRVTPVSY